LQVFHPFAQKDEAQVPGRGCASLPMTERMGTGIRERQSPRSQKRNHHPTDEDLSVGTPDHHPTGEDLSVRWRAGGARTHFAEVALVGLERF
jgi:hypothetical protein